MKAKVVLFVVLISLGFILSSCQTESCPAYGDYSKYQVDKAK